MRQLIYTTKISNRLRNDFFNMSRLQCFQKRTKEIRNIILRWNLCLFQIDINTTCYNCEVLAYVAANLCAFRFEENYTIISFNRSQCCFSQKQLFLTLAVASCLSFEFMQIGQSGGQQMEYWVSWIVHLARVHQGPPGKGVEVELGCIWPLWKGVALQSFDTLRLKRSEGDKYI